MTAERPDAAGAQEDLARLLLDFGRMPGRYAVRSREPRLLFQEFDAVAQWALGRFPALTSADLLAIDRRELADAALLFIQRACFDREGTHYQVLGLAREEFSPEVLRGRYRALIRLTHPDIGLNDLPADAAGMVNRAYDVLRDDGLRRRYNEELDRRASSNTISPPLSSQDRGQGSGRATSRPRFAEMPVISTGRPRPPWMVAGLALRERCSAWLARYPRRVVLMSMAGAVAVLLGMPLLWLVLDAESSANNVLVVSRSASAPVSEPEASDLGSVVAALSAPRPVVASEPPAQIADAHLPVLAPSAPEEGGDSTKPRPAATPAPDSKPHGPGQVASPTAPRETERRSASIENGENPLARSGQLPNGAVTAQPVAVDSVPRINMPEPALARTAAVSAPLRTSAPTPAFAPEPTLDRMQAVRPPPVPATIWKADVGLARDHLDTIVAALGDAAGAQRLDAELARMNVKGSRLRPMNKLHAHGAPLVVERTAWVESWQSEVLNIRSTLVIQALADSTRVSVHQLSADFRGTFEGTVLERLELQ